MQPVLRLTESMSLIFGLEDAFVQEIDRSWDWRDTPHPVGI